MLGERILKGQIMNIDDLRTAYELGRDDSDDVEDELADLRKRLSELEIVAKVAAYYVEDELADLRKRLSELEILAGRPAAES